MSRKYINNIKLNAVWYCQHRTVRLEACNGFTLMPLYESACGLVVQTHFPSGFGEVG